MTDQDKRELSLRIATLAEQAGLAGELVWERAWECPAGHVMSGRAVNDTCLHYDEESRQVCGQDVRHSRIALDLTTSTHLLPLLEAWIQQEPVRHFFETRWDYIIKQWSCYAWFMGQQRPGRGEHESRTIAEALAFAEVLEAEKAAENA